MIFPTTRFLLVCASAMLLMTAIPFHVAAQESPDLFTIYLVRHAEKQSDSNDPPLTACGIQRSESLSAFFEAVPLDVVYSTDYKRTQSTAVPTARAQGLSIKSYSTQALEEMAEQLVRNGQTRWSLVTAIRQACSRVSWLEKKSGPSMNRFTTGCTRWSFQKKTRDSMSSIPPLTARDVSA